MHGLYSLYILFAVIFNPAAQTPQYIAMGRRMVTPLRYLGLLLLFAGAAIHLFVAQGLRVANAVPDTPVSVAAFSQTSLTGKLDEALLTGYLQMDHIEHVTLPRKYALLTAEQTLIPVTEADWRPGEPVKIYIATYWFSQTETAQDHANGLAKLGLAPGSAGAVPITSIVQTARFFGFEGDVFAVIRAAGLPLASPAYVLSFMEKDRQKLLAEAYLGPKILAAIFAGLGVLLLLLSFGLRKSLARFDA
jgi:hypothetical protein